MIHIFLLASLPSLWVWVSDLHVKFALLVLAVAGVAAFAPVLFLGVLRGRGGYLHRLRSRITVKSVATLIFEASTIGRHFLTDVPQLLRISAVAVFIAVINMFVFGVLLSGMDVDFFGDRLDILTIVLMLCAAALHASWHALVKSSDNQLTVLVGMSMVATVVAAIGLPFVALPPAAVWPMLGTSLLFHSRYRFCLAQAYAHGDLGAAYPLARGPVPLFATGAGVSALGQTLSLGQVLGVCIVSARVCWLGSEAIRQLRGKLLLAAAGVGLMVTGYSVPDSYGVRLSANWLSFIL